MRGFAVLLLLATPAHAASFDCTKATTAVEKAICASPRLNALDDELAIAVRDARQAERPIQAAHSSWIREGRNRCGGSEACLEQVYLLRISQLRSGSLFALEKAPGTIFGRYVDVKENCFADKTAPDGKRCEGTVENVMTIKRGRGNTIGVTMELVFFNGHLCSFESTGEWSNGELRLPQFEKSNEQNCVLVATFDGERVSIRDPLGVCRHNFCGANGAFEGYTLTKVRSRR